MDNLGNAEMHFWLTRSVARVMGISFSEEMSCGRISAKEYSDLVTNCRTCQRTATCSLWLASQASLSRTAPEGCKNAPELEALARRH